MSSPPLASQPLQTFLERLSSAEPVPGGGSVAALGGALAAALVAMVCRLTIGKKGYEAVETDLTTILERAEPLEQELRNLMQADIDAYATVISTYRLPKNTEAEKAARSAAIQEALKEASRVPMQVAEKCSVLLELAGEVAQKGNKNAASDAGVATLMAEAGMRGAALNVSINLGAIKEEAFVSSHRRRLNTLLVSAAERKQEILQRIEARL